MASAESSALEQARDSVRKYARKLVTAHPQLTHVHIHMGLRAARPELCGNLSVGATKQLVMREVERTRKGLPFDYKPTNKVGRPASSLTKAKKKAIRRQYRGL